MGAKLSKKKKGYCLGAGKDGESTDTTEVEQKETENQEGQKDAAEPKGEKTPADQSQNNGVSEEKKDKTSGEEVISGETNKDQKPEIKSTTEQEKGEEKDQSQAKEEQVEIKPAASENVCEEKKVTSPSEDKPKTEPEIQKTPETKHDLKETLKDDEVKETPLVATVQPTQESKPAVEKEDADAKRPEEAVTEPTEATQEEEVVKLVSEPVMKVKVEITERASAPVETAEHVSEKTVEVHTPPKVKELGEHEKLEKVPEKVEPPAPESVPIEPVSVPVVEATVPEVQCSVRIEVVEPEKLELSEPVTLTEVESLAETVAPVESVLPESTPAQASVEAENHPPKEPELVPEPEPVQAPEPVEPVLTEAVSEIKPVEVIVHEPPVAAFQGEDCVKSETAPETVPCPEAEKISEVTQDVLSEPLPPKSNEVPDQTDDAQEEPENQESLGCDQGTDAATETLPTETSTEQTDGPESPVIQNGPSKHSEVEQVEVQPVSTEVTVEDKGDQKEVTKEHENQEVEEDCKPETEKEISNNENHKTPLLDTSETPEPAPHCISEDTMENHETPAEEVKHENKPSAPEIMDKHGVGNGLPIKEEIKVHLENGSDKELHEELHNGQSESHEIQVCNE